MSTRPLRRRRRPLAAVGRVDVPVRHAHDAFLDGRAMGIVKGRNGIELVAYPIGGGPVHQVVQQVPSRYESDRRHR